ncbi:uncharacterized protein MELLADRAFT_68084 [Melampsora larici-populina 98AG31]|uniref:Uncharacterized protein n=1 Tax=Melampsora larici-populina (strain 98AG31 / pathotype 3-4-7) TaxID=747676 RepID=F4S5I6_MELLP|nr:uncharacterized protein MELLADRAFT_68084 [Melampsora larici-populina 98AG31]EGG00030.1 hypothetical protein MELLADRAFT_68084 [Melampsora larici-populina 98AG31]
MGLPQQASHRSSPKITAAALLQRHLPAEPTAEEVEHWASYAAKQTQYLDVNIQAKMDEIFAKNPSATELEIVFRDEEKEKKLVSTPGGGEKLVMKKHTEREKLALKNIKKKLCDKRAAAVEPYFRNFSGPIKVLLKSQEVHSDTEMDPEKPGKFRKIKLNWRTPQLDELIQLADKAAPNWEGTKKQNDKLMEFFQSRGPYSPNVPDPEDQLPPKTLPKCLIKPEILAKGIDAITIDSLELSNTQVDLQSAIDILKQKLGKGNAMTISSS